MKVTGPGMARPSTGAGAESRNPARTKDYRPSEFAPRGRGRDANAHASGARGYNAAAGNGDGREDGGMVFGIPSDELTPAVQQAIARLMERADQLSHRLKQMQQKLEKQVRKARLDPFTGVMARPALIQALENEAQLDPPPLAPRTLIICEVSEIDLLTQRYGHACKDSLIALLADLISGFVHPPHLLGYLGCNDFAILLHNVGQQEGWRRTQAIEQSLREAAFEWEGQLVDCKLTFGVHEIGPLDTVHSMLGAVDGVLRACREMRHAHGSTLPAGMAG